MLHLIQSLKIAVNDLWNYIGTWAEGSLINMRNILLYSQFFSASENMFIQSESFLIWILKQIELIDNSGETLLLRLSMFEKEYVGENNNFW